jgi:hypothetical protein
MPPNPVLGPLDKSQAEARAAVIAATTVPITAAGVLWIRRATRVNATAIPARINSGIRRTRSAIGPFTA